VMIPTLLMNIPTSPNNQTQYFVCKRLWFLRVLFLFVFILWHGKARRAYIGIEERRKEVPWGVEMANNRRGKKSGSNTLSFSRLVKSSPSFLPEVTPECN
jgi:hypothetical protein